MDFIYDLLDDLYAELEEAQQNSMNKGMTRECLDDIDKLSHAAKSLETIIAMKSGGSYRDYRDNRDGRGYGHYYDDEGSDYGARRRDSMGRYRSRSYRDRYSDSEKESLRSQLQQMMTKAKDEKEKDAIRIIMRKMED